VVVKPRVLRAPPVDFETVRTLLRTVDTRPD
jgi:hypothetical protein